MNSALRVILYWLAKFGLSFLYIGLIVIPTTYFIHDRFNAVFLGTLLGLMFAPFHWGLEKKIHAAFERKQ